MRPFREYESYPPASSCLHLKTVRFGEKLNHDVEVDTQSMAALLSRVGLEAVSTLSPKSPAIATRSGGYGDANNQSYVLLLAPL
jgi:hypothetical protein